MTHIRTFFWLAVASVMLVSVDQAVAQRRAETGLFVAGRLGLSTYGGDRDLESGEGIFDPAIASKFDKASFSAGAEIGTILSPTFSVSVGLQFGKYLEINKNYPYAEGETPDPGFLNLTEGSSQSRITIPLLLRANLLPSKTFSPYLHGGANIMFGSHQFVGEDSKSDVGFGPSFGAGVDVVVSNHASIFIETTQHLVFGDEKADAANPTVEANDAAYDVLGFWGFGLQYRFKSACAAPMVTSVSAPARVAVGEPAAMTAMLNENTCQPTDVMWDFGDGETGSGLGANHIYSTPGTYTVNVTATNSAGSGSGTAMVEVFDPCPIDAEIIAINLNPSDPIINEAITFSADIRGTTPVTYRWNFGDGGTATGATASHMYSEPGEYTVSLECTNCGGSDSRSITIMVQEFRCSDITELNTVFFGHNSAALDDEAKGLLDENLEVLNECPDLLTRLDGYSDRRERNPLRLSERRASAVEQYYIEQGIPASRLMARGLGRDPLAGKGIDGRRNRRVDSIIVDSFE